MTALTDAQVAALREAAEKIVAMEVQWHVPWHVRATAMTEDVRIEVYEYVHAVSPDVVLALLAERDALQAEVGDARRTSQFHKDNHLAAEAALSALRARETGLREERDALELASDALKERLYTAELEHDKLNTWWQCAEADLATVRQRIVNAISVSCDCYGMDSADGRHCAMPSIRDALTAQCLCHDNNWTTTRHPDCPLHSEAK